MSIPSVDIPEDRKEKIEKKAKKGFKKFKPHYVKNIEAQYEKNNDIEEDECVKIGIKTTKPKWKKIRKDISKEIAKSFQDEVVELLNEIEEVADIPGALKKKVATKAINVIVNKLLDALVKNYGGKVLKRLKGEEVSESSAESESD